MKTIFIFISSFLLSSSIIEVNEMRATFHKIETQNDVVNFINRYENSSEKKVEPYLASAIMRKAEFTVWPNIKLKYFNQGKKKLESYIRNNSFCVEGKYVRVLVQSQVPKILNYSSDIKSDKKFIQGNIKKSDLPKSYQQQILNNIKNLK